MDKAGELYIEIDLRGDAETELHAYNMRLREAMSWGGKFVNSVDELDAKMIDYARSIGLTDDRLKDLIEQRNLANKLGVDVAALQKFRQASDESERSQRSLASAMGAVAALGLGHIIRRWAGEMIDAAEQAKGAWAGLSAIVRSQFGEDAVQPAIQQIRQVGQNLRGIVSESDLADAAKALTSMGFSAGDAAKLLEANAKAHMVAGNQTYSTAEALKVYAKALKDGNSATIDVTGNSANLDQIMKSLGYQMQDLSDPVKGAAAQQAYLNYQMKWASVYFDEAEKAMAGWKGETGFANAKIQDLMRFGGELLVKVLTPLMSNGINPLLTALGHGVEWLQKNEWAMAALRILLVALIPIVGVFLVAALWSAASAMFALNAQTLIMAASIAGIIAVFLGLFLILEDFYTWMEGGESLIGSWLGPWEKVGWVIKAVVVYGIYLLMGALAALVGWIPIAIAAVIWVVYDLWNAFTGGPSILKKVWESISAVFVNGAKWLWNLATTYGKYVIMALFPVSAVYFYWDEIVAAASSLAEGAVSLLSRYGRYIIMALFPVSALWFYKDEIMEFFRGLPDQIIEALSGSGNKLKEFFKDKFGGVVDLVARIQGEPQIEARATGGPVAANRPYIVGDGGRPELFVPAQDGYILPSVPTAMPAPANREVANSNTINLSITLNGSATQEDARMIESAVKDALARILADARTAGGLNDEGAA